MMLIVAAIGLVAKGPAAAEADLAADAGQSLSLLPFISDISRMQLVGQVAGSGTSSQVVVRGNYAYIDEGRQLVVLDITNPAAPTVVGKSPPLEVGFTNLTVAGNIASVSYTHLDVYKRQFYSNALAYAPLYVAGRLTGAFDSRADILPLESVAMGTVRTPQPAAVLLNRSVSLAMGVGTVALLYFIGRVLFDRPDVGLLAALLLAVAPNPTYHSRIVTTDAMVTFFILLTMLMAALIWRQGRTRHYVLAGLAVGLAAGTKYNGAMVALIAVSYTHLAAGAHRRSSWRRRWPSFGAGQGWPPAT